MFSPAFGCFVRINFQNFLNEFFVSCLNVFYIFFECQAHGFSLSNLNVCDLAGTFS